MLQLTKQIDDPNGIVSKLVFEGDNAIAETVVYKYGKRSVICFSVQSGCPVGCSFCGTGNKFIRDLSASEMVQQIDHGLNIVDNDVSDVQLMSMSMGDPMLNWIPVREVVKYMRYTRPYYSFYISTVGFNMPSVMSDLITLGIDIPKFGLQFSLHGIYEDQRRKLFRNKNLPYMRIDDMLRFGRRWTVYAGKPAYFNYIANDDATEEEAKWLAKHICDYRMHVTCSVMCNTKNMTKANDKPAKRLAAMILCHTDNKNMVSVFDPAGQDTVGGGCGQLLYVQEKLKSMGK